MGGKTKTKTMTREVSVEHARRHEAARCVRHEMSGSPLKAETWHDERTSLNGWNEAIRTTAAIRCVSGGQGVTQSLLTTTAISTHYSIKASGSMSNTYLYTHMNTSRNARKSVKNL